MIRSIFIALAVLVLGVMVSYSQDAGCGTVVSKRQKQLLHDIYARLPGSGARIASSVYNVAITAHVVRQTVGTGGITPAEISDAMDDLNFYFANAGLNFFIITTNFIDSDQYYDLVTSDEIEMASGNDIENTVNVYFVNTVETPEGLDLCGYTYLPFSGPERMIIANGCAINGSTFPHEMGHFFSLLHTHGLTSNGTDELVDGSNCSDAGDEICDTPADPVLSLSKVSSSCVYTGTETDDNGDAYAPNVRNIMSYAPVQCRDEFSSEQYSRISAAYTSYRNNLYSKALVAKFEVDDASVCPGNDLEFHNTSVAGISYEWQFEGGVPSSSVDENPTVTYDVLGTYDVRLIATGADEEKDTMLLTDFVIVEALERPLFTERFEDFEIPDIQIINPDLDSTFVVIDTVAFSGSQCAMIPFYSYADLGEMDYLKLSAVNTELNKEVTIDFEYAYTYFDNGTDQFYDELQIVYRHDCDKDWITVWQLSGEDLATAPPEDLTFVPDAGQWAHVSTSFVVVDSIKSVEVALRTVNGYGNNLYIDDFGVFADSEVDFGTITLNTTPVSCHDDTDGHMDIDVVGPGSSYEYSLDNVSYSPGGVFNGLLSGQYLVYVLMDANDTLMRSFTIGNPDSLIAEYQIDVPTCTSGGIVDVVLSGLGGTGSYEFALDAGGYDTESQFSNLSEGLHTGYVRDAEGCEANVDFEVVPYESLVVNASKSDILCYGAADGLIQLEVSGGLGSVNTYVNGVDFGDVTEFPNLASGSYELIVTDETLCEWSQTFEVKEPNEVQIALGSTASSCAAEPEASLLAIAVGGNDDFQYSIDTGDTWQSTGNFTGLYNREYLVIVIDAQGCEYSEVIEIEGPELLVASVEVEDEECYHSGTGSFVIQTMGGMPPYTIFLNDENVEPNISGISSGKYVLRVEDQNDCVFSDTLVLESLYDSVPKPEISVEANVLVVNERSGHEINWYLNGQKQADVDNRYEVLRGGVYTASYVNEVNGCEAFSDDYSVPSFKRLAKDVKIGPNPTDGQLDLFIPEMLQPSVDEISLYDISGNKLLATPYQASLFLSHPPGLYFLIIRGNGFSQEMRIVIN